jgi:hypothetical protein
VLAWLQQGASLRLESGFDHASFHVANGVFPTIKNRLRHERMPNIELSDPLERCDWRNIPEMQTMTGIGAQAVRNRDGDCCFQTD